MKITITRLSSAMMILAVFAGGCGNSAMSLGNEYIPPDEDPDELGFERLIEESDIYKLDGDTLYVQNPDTGFNVLDVSDPSAPSLVDTLDVTGQAGELYVRDERVFILFGQAAPACTLQPDLASSWPATVRSEAVAVVTARTEPKVAGRFCLPGEMVASRLVGDVLYMITTVENYGAFTTLIFSLDMADSYSIQMADFIDFPGEAREVHVTREAIFVTQPWSTSTEVQYVDISDPEGIMTERGSITVSGAPQGRFHMDAHGDTFRIVTYSGIWAGANLHVIDISNPDVLTLMGSMTNLAPGEELWASVFDGERAYVVTYLRWAPDPDPRSRWTIGWDPLWVIDLSDPHNPTALGELVIPGWSNYIFPRGDRLVAVGRGNGGVRVALSLYDVSDPTDPAELEALEFGPPLSNSEANFDFRGISIIESEELGELPLIAVPVSEYIPTAGGCDATHWLYMVDLHENDLVPRGEMGFTGRVRRSFDLGDQLYAVSDKEVEAIDVSDRSDPFTTAEVEVGDPTVADECVWNDFEINIVDDDPISYFPFGCSAAPEPTTDLGNLAWAALLLAALLLLARRRTVR